MKYNPILLASITIVIVLLLMTAGPTANVAKGIVHLGDAIADFVRYVVSLQDTPARFLASFFLWVGIGVLVSIAGVMTVYSEPDFPWSNSFMVWLTLGTTTIIWMFFMIMIITAKG